MLTDLNTSVTTISPEQLDALFEGTPEATPSADDLKLGKVETKSVTIGEAEIPAIDLDALDKEAEEKTEEKVDDKEKEEKVEVPEVKEEEKKEDIKVDTGLLKSSVEYLIQKGLFKDFEGREDLEMTEDIYAQVLEAQVNQLVADRYEAKKSSAGEYGQAIIDFVEKGGNPDLIIDLFKEQREITSFDVSTDDAQKELISRYYKDVLGWKPERIKRQLDFLNTQEDALKDEASDIKSKYEDHFKQQTQQLQQQQAAYEQEQVKRQRVFESSIKEAIKSYDTDEKRRQRLESMLFKYKTLDDGSKVNDFYLKFAEWQSDPKKYVELVEFISDHENYLKRKEVEAQNKAVDKTFKFVKGNAAVTKNTGSKHEEPDEKQDKKAGTDFSVIFKK